MILCIDIGNTGTHFGFHADGRIARTGDVPTAQLDAADSALHAALTEEGLRAVAWCSVVPAASEALRGLLKKLPEGVRTFQLTHETCPLPIAYPRPVEIGQDRLAAAVAAHALCGAPCVVVDMGTAVTIDLVSENGYEGGLIAPGLEIMTRYLHEQTALLPALEPDELMAGNGVGKSTLEAMRRGCAVGFEGMIRALLNHVQATLAGRTGGKVPAVVATGGSAGALPQRWLPEITYRAHLTLEGLALCLRETPGKE